MRSRRAARARSSSSASTRRWCCLSSSRIDRGPNEQRGGALLPPACCARAPCYFIMSKNRRQCPVFLPSAKSAERGHRAPCPATVCCIWCPSPSPPALKGGSHRLSRVHRRAIGSLRNQTGRKRVRRSAVHSTRAPTSSAFAASRSSCSSQNSSHRSPRAAAGKTSRAAGGSASSSPQQTRAPQSDGDAVPQKILEPR